MGMNRLGVSLLLFALSDAGDHYPRKNQRPNKKGDTITKKDKDQPLPEMHHCAANVRA
jgi:hypothetical protein